MSEQNKALVVDVFERANDGDLSILEQHPGLHEIIPTIERSQAGAEQLSRTIHEVLAEGDWVSMRMTSVERLKVNFGDMPAGTEVTFEVIGMYRVKNGVIVEQHSQGAVIATS